MKKAMIGLLAVLLIGGGAYYWVQRRNQAKKRAQVTSVIPVQEGSIEDVVETTGEVSPLNRVEVSPPIAGRIEKLLVDEGAVVKEGDILAWMSSTDRAAILDAARSMGPEELQKMQDTYKPTPVIAPLSGTVIVRDVVVGQTVSLGTTLFVLSDRLIVVVQVDEVDIGRVKVGMPATITLDAYPSHTVDGRVFNILHEGKNVSNVITYDVKVAPQRVPGFFRSQMTANVKLIVDRKEKALLVPYMAVSENQSGEKQVLLRGPQGRPVPTVVQTGLESGENVEIVSGLTAADSVVITGQKYVSQSQKSVANSPFGFPPGAKKSSSNTGAKRTKTNGGNRSQ
ncbi:MAG TPA: efflux RND transporter periplasmic adaptor subunit [Elusimicrobiota bacterium]|nr:efflux RND transporter periplasmic adaptor subunit [Elusimicrobiota bacterium]